MNARFLDVKAWATVIFLAGLVVYLLPSEVKSAAVREYREWSVDREYRHLEELERAGKIKLLVNKQGLR